AITLSRGTPIQWALEAHKIAIDVAFTVPIDADLGEDYLKLAQPMVDQQLALAGLRLARTERDFQVDRGRARTARIQTRRGRGGTPPFERGGKWLKTLGRSRAAPSRFISNRSGPASTDCRPSISSISFTRRRNRSTWRSTI